MQKIKLWNSLICLVTSALTYKPNGGGNYNLITIDVWIIMKYCVQVISFNLLASNLYKYITKLLIFNLMNLTCFNDVMIFIKNIYMELIWWRENLNLFLDVWNQSNVLSINSNSWNKVHKNTWPIHHINTFRSIEYIVPHKFWQYKKCSTNEPCWTTFNVVKWKSYPILVKW